MSGLVWLASYPKSGNTWLRAFLANYLAPSPQGVDINSLPPIYAGDRKLFDRVTGLDSSDLTHDEIDLLTPEYYRRMAHMSRDNQFIKIHSGFLANPGGTSQIPPDVTSAAIYIVRNPMDVAVSFAHHLARPVDEVITNMEDPDFAFSPATDRMHPHLRQKILSWSMHAQSWLDQKSTAVHLMQYESMLERPEETFSDCVRYLGLDYDAVRLRAALDRSSFQSLRAQELAKGFRERPNPGIVFFRNGKSGQGKETLRSDQIERIARQHSGMMTRFGYL